MGSSVPHKQATDHMGIMLTLMHVFWRLAYRLSVGGMAEAVLLKVIAVVLGINSPHAGQGVLCSNGRKMIFG